MEQKGKEKQSPIQYKEKQIKRGIPKNIRQIGEVTGKQKIYIEDYVVTYLNQLAHPTNSISRGAVLLGEWVHYEKEDVLFISGAVEADNLSFDMNEITFGDDTWTDIYEKAGKYFENINVVGWFLSRLGYSVKLTDAMLRLQREHFKEEGSVLYLMDALEQEDAFYLFRGEQLVKQMGYYIYYERNTPMQNYLIENQGMERGVREDKRIEYKDGQLLHNYHEIMAGRRERKEEKRITGMLYVTSALLIIVFLALSISIFNNYDKLQAMQLSLDNMISQNSGNSSEDMEQAGDVTSTVQQETASDNTQTESAAMAENGPGDTVAANDGTTQEIVASSEETTTQAPVASTDEAVQTAGDTVQTASMGNQNYYTVQQGDTLLSISQQMYHSDAYIETLRQANEIGENDYIYPGQQIVIPSIQ